jgi:hypothetical protein
MVHTFVDGVPLSCLLPGLMVDIRIDGVTEC